MGVDLQGNGYFLTANNCINHYTKNLFSPLSLGEEHKINTDIQIENTNHFLQEDEELRISELTIKMAPGRAGQHFLVLACVAFPDNPPAIIQCKTISLIL